jgi:hypothetical protein
MTTLIYHYSSLKSILIIKNIYILVSQYIAASFAARQKTPRMRILQGSQIPLYPENAGQLLQGPDLYDPWEDVSVVIS